MSMSRDVVIRLLGDANSAVAAQRAAAEAADVSVQAYRRAEREQQRQARAAERAARQQAEAMEKVGRGAMIFGAAVAAGLGLAVKAAIDWESAWAGVQKTVDGTPEQMAELEAALRRLATTLPATHEEIAGVAEAAGQLGIARDDILEFTKVAIAMGVSTNLSADEAATSMARLSNIMGTSSADVSRMGSAIVALGNTGATTEGEILSLALRLGAAGRQAGMSEGEVLGLAQAMSSLGIEAEAGGTAMSTVIKTINNAVMDGGKSLEAVAQVAGTTAGAFAEAWRVDAAGALVLVVEGLARTQAAGENVNSVIADLGFSGIRTSDTLLRLAGNASGLNTSLSTGNRAWAENTALVNEANQRYDTAASKIAMARNQITDASITIGQSLMPMVSGAVDIVADLARGFQELPGPMQDSVGVIGAVAAGVALVGGAAIIAVPKIAAFRAQMALLATSSSGVRRGMGAVGTFMTGPWGAAIGVATVAIAGLIAWLGNSSRESEEAAGAQSNLMQAIRATGGAIDDTVRAAALADLEDNGLKVWADNGTIALEDLLDASLGVPAALERVREQMIATRDAMTAEYLGGGPDAERNAAAARQGIDDNIAQLEVLAAASTASATEGQRNAAAIAASGAAAESSVSSMDALTLAQQGVGDSAKEAETYAKKLANAMDALNGGALNLRDATRGYEDAIDSARESVAEHGRTLDITTEAGRANAASLDRVATSAMAQANAIAANGGSYEAFRNSLNTSRQALVDSAIAMGLAEDEAWALANQILRIPEAHELDIQLPTYQQVVQELLGLEGRIRDIPTETWTNIGVVSAAAMAELQAVGFATRTLPDGTVEVYADTRQAIDDLAALTRTRYMTIVAQTVDGSTARAAAVQGLALSSYADRGIAPARAVGGAVWPGGTFLVGEKGPELVRFGAAGYVTPADLTAQALRQPAAAPSPALALPGAAGPAGYGSSVTNVHHTRTFAPVFQVSSARPMSASELLTAARDEEWLHG